ncbi:cytochrome P450 [Crucibulum laeve]|uniref:Cytochrome P450 n=1 Tax=Crucibulum laeve TaxID=68775 RepID=A0A5C3LRX9_9AGAR|nr:cytochrome P450 [Crucibulum laeve]
MIHVYRISLTEIALTVSVVWFLYKLHGRFSKKGLQTTPLNGPPNKSFIFGLYRHIQKSDDLGLVYEEWATRYGPAFKVAGSFGTSQVVICDPKANAHFYAKETYVYVQTKLSRVFVENLFGRGLLWSEGDSHKRQRKALSPAFSNAAIRKLTSVFYDSSYKMKAAWDSTIDASTVDTLIDVQKWMDRIALDSVGIAGFGHDFGSLDGHRSSVAEVFDMFGSADSSLISDIIFFLGPVLPVLQKLPTKRNKIFKQLRTNMGEIAEELLERTRREKEGIPMSEEKSIIGLLLKAENSSPDLQISQEEIIAQVVCIYSLSQICLFSCTLWMQNVLLLAGYVTTSVSLTWALIELCRKPEKQQKLRDELAEFAGTDPTFDQLATGLPYLDGVVHEVLRLHPPVRETTRVAAEDDLIPFSNPVITASGETITSIVIAKGTVVTSPILHMNTCESFWGPDAREFEPERWLKEELGPAKDIQGHRHLLTFSDGPRICLGKSFALAEFKAVLSVLICNYTFELPDGPTTKIDNYASIIPRPKLEGEIGARLPLKVKRIN